jgi:hypothetical protein
MNTIITVKAFRRPYYMKQLLSSLKNNGIGDRKIMISVDRHMGTMSKMNEVIRQAKLNSVTVIPDRKYGCAGNMNFCFKYAFEENNYDAMIHLEEDVIIAGDYFKWMDWALEFASKDEQIFAVCPSRRLCRGGSKGLLEGNIIEKHFECQGGFGITRKQWEYIESLGGIFGVIGTIPGGNSKNWKKKVKKIHPDGSWAWPFRCYFLRDKFCLVPKIGRANNIGAEQGRFNISKDWHEQNVYDYMWIGNEIYRKADLSNIKYTITQKDKRWEQNSST